MQTLNLGFAWEFRSVQVSWHELRCWTGVYTASPETTTAFTFIQWYHDHLNQMTDDHLLTLKWPQFPFLLASAQVCRRKQQWVKRPSGFTCKRVTDVSVLTASPAASVCSGPELLCWRCTETCRWKPETQTQPGHVTFIYQSESGQ